LCKQEHKLKNGNQNLHHFSDNTKTHHQRRSSTIMEWQS